MGNIHATALSIYLKPSMMILMATSTSPVGGRASRPVRTQNRVDSVKMEGGINSLATDNPNGIDGC
jgi:hypothetical protein